MSKERLDVLVHRQGFAESREKAQAVILSGKVLVNDTPVTKPGTKVPEDAKIRIKGNVDPYVSRAAYKLIAAIDEFKIDLKDKACLDVGASTGGFTQVCLENGARKVYAFDAGHSQMHWKVRTHEKVVNHEGVNMRDTPLDLIPEQVQFICIDTSFISLRMILPNVIRYLVKNGEIVALIKPQHEVKKEEVGKGGVIKDPELHERVKKEITEFAQSIGLGVRGLINSPIEGGTGNKEFLIFCEKIK